MTSVLELCCLLLCLLAFSIDKVVCDDSNHASVLNVVALDVGGLANAMQEMHALRHGSQHHWEALKLRLLSVEEELWTGMDASVKKNVTDYLGMKVKFHSVEAVTVTRFVDDEGWSYGAAATLSILDSIETAVAWGKETENATVLSVAFGGYETRPMHLHGGDLFGLFKRVHWHSVHGSEVCLVAKTGALGELSDWRDLQFFVGSASAGVLEWVGHVRAVYRSYVLRPAFAMPEPRPALLEAAHLTSATVTRRTFFPEDICVMGGGGGNSAAELECSWRRTSPTSCKYLRGTGPRGCPTACTTASKPYDEILLPPNRVSTVGRLGGRASSARRTRGYITPTTPRVGSTRPQIPHQRATGGSAWPLVRSGPEVKSESTCISTSPKHTTLPDMATHTTWSCPTSL